MKLNETKEDMTKAEFLEWANKRKAKQRTQIKIAWFSLVGTWILFFLFLVSVTG